MLDKEKLIRGLEKFKDAFAASGDGDKWRVVRTDIIEDAISLLEAQELKKRESKAMLPCKCGCKRREHWFGGDDPEKFEMLKCSHCGFTAYGKNATDVIRNWNKAVREDGDT